jgi:CelD/BcsL family acetyltransferase involved in cellulose biosynthesis
MLSTQVICDPSELSEVEVSWDALAVACEQPMMAPSWSLAWWRHLAPPHLALRVLVIRDGEAIVGLAPFIARHAGAYTTYELLAGGAGRMSPLAWPGREWEVADAAWTALLSASPRPDVVRLESAPLGASASAWQAVSRTRAPGRAPAIVRQSAVIPCPVMALTGTFEGWLAGKSSNFRSEMRRLRRRCVRAGATIRRSGPDAIDDDLETYLRLHLTRWQGRSAASTYAAIARPLGAALAEMAHALPAERFRLYVMELGGAPISAQLFIAAGGELMYHNGGWDPAHAGLKPGMVGLLHAIEHGLAHGDHRLDFGPGAYPYKLRFTSRNDPVIDTSFVVAGPRLALVAAQSARNAAGRLLGR